MPVMEVSHHLEEAVCTLGPGVLVFACHCGLHVVYRAGLPKLQTTGLMDDCYYGN